MNLTQKIKEFFKIEKKINIGFLVTLPNLWENIEPLIFKLIKDNKFKVFLILCKPNHEFHSINQYEKMIKILKELKLDFIFENDFKVKKNILDFIFYQMPYDNFYSDKFHSANIKKNKINICFLQYGGEIYGGSESITNCFNLNIITSAKRIYARSKNHKLLYLKYSSIREDKILVTGHPKFDKIINKKPSDKIKNLIPKNKKKVLWATSYINKFPPDWCSFYDYFNIVKDFIEKNKNFFLIFRPHPLLKQSLDNHKYKIKEVKNFFEFINENENAILLQDTEYSDLFAISDLLISDINSFLISYMSTSKPILFLDSKNLLGFNDEGKFVKNLYIAKNEDEFLNFFELFYKGEDPMKQKRLASLYENFYILDGNSSSRIAYDLENMINTHK